MDKQHSKRNALIIFIIGLVVLVAGVATFLIIKNRPQEHIDDTEFLMTAGEWAREDQPDVIWDFERVGEGKLTTDGHLNNYIFKWKTENGKLTIETDWLYDLNDEFDYTIDQGAKTLTIKNAEKNIEVKFIAKERPEKPQEEAPEAVSEPEAEPAAEGEGEAQAEPTTEGKAESTEEATTENQ